MEILAKVGDALQGLLGQIAQEAANESGVIARLRKFTPQSLARTFILGFLRDPNASDEKLAQMAVQCGAAVTPQAIEQRHTPKLVDFLEKLFRGARMVKILSRARKQTANELLDSSWAKISAEWFGFSEASGRRTATPMGHGRSGSPDLGNENTQPRSQAACR